MSKKKISRRLSPEEAKYLGLPVKPQEANDIRRRGEDTSTNPRYQVSRKQWNVIETQRIDKAFGEQVKKNKDVASFNNLDNDTVTNQYANDSEIDELPEVKLSAYVNGSMLDIEAYCKHYNLDFANMRSYKFVMWPVPYFNIAFNAIVVDDIQDPVTPEKIEEIIKANMSITTMYTVTPLTRPSRNWFDRAIYSDTHIGMDTNKDDIAMYADPWNLEELRETNRMFIETVLEEKRGTHLVVDDLGDLLDGMNEETVRGGHRLPQNMNNIRQIDAGVEFKLTQLHSFMEAYDTVTFNNICNDNHSGDFGYTVNKTLFEIANIMYPGRVKVANHLRFLNAYWVGEFPFCITHGKDKVHNKSGFKAFLNPTNREKIDLFIKSQKMYGGKKIPEFAKGDTHLYATDSATSDDFDYLSMMALSPSSEWVQTNFKKGRRGFILQHIDKVSGRKLSEPVWL